MENNQTTRSVDIKVRIDKLLDSDSSTKAFASVTIAGAFAVHDIRIIERDGKLMVGMPFQSYTTNGVKKYTDTFHAVTAEARVALTNAVMEAYEQAVKK